MSLLPKNLNRVASPKPIPPEMEAHRNKAFGLYMINMKIRGLHPTTAQAAGPVNATLRKGQSSLNSQTREVQILSKIDLDILSVFEIANVNDPVVQDRIRNSLFRNKAEAQLLAVTKPVKGRRSSQEQTRIKRLERDYIKQVDAENEVGMTALYAGIQEDVQKLVRDLRDGKVRISPKGEIYTTGKPDQTNESTKDVVAAIVHTAPLKPSFARHVASDPKAEIEPSFEEQKAALETRIDNLRNEIDELVEMIPMAVEDLENKVKNAGWDILIKDFLANRQIQTADELAVQMEKYEIGGFDALNRVFIERRQFEGLVEVKPLVRPKADYNLATLSPDAAENKQLTILSNTEDDLEKRYKTLKAALHGYGRDLEWVRDELPVLYGLLNKTLVAAAPIAKPEPQAS
ncbi:hypothetical protein N9Z27_00710 [Alphaproteobacteria bacterium]|nr:hypothetical protein [Alphaproteobacteria bacterium]